MSNLRIEPELLGHDDPAALQVDVGPAQRVKLSGSQARERGSVVQRSQNATVGMDRAVVSHESALVLHGLSDVLPDTVHLLIAREHRGIRPPAGVTLHTATTAIPGSDIATRHGIRVTTPSRAIIDAASAGTAPEQIQMAIHQALNQGRTTPAQLTEQANRQGGYVADLIARTIQEAAA